MGKKCSCGSGKYTIYGLEGGKRPTCCRECKSDKMFNIITKKCSCGSGIIPYYGLKGDKRATCCSKCKSDTMFNIKTKKCSCGKGYSIYGLKEDKRATCCVECKKDDMVNIARKKCSCGSGMTPIYGLEGDKIPNYCRECKIADMVDLRNNKCSCGSGIQPYYGLETDKRATCCSECKKDTMVNIKYKRCKADHCDMRARNIRCRGYCSRCFFYTFPDEKLTRNYKTKENTIVDHIKQKFPNYDWVHDRRVVDGCSLKRPDLYCDFGSHIVVIEVDEDAHRGYSCEEKRMFTIINDFGVRSTIFIRINPDRYTDEKTNRVIPSPFVMKKDTGKLEVKNKKELDNRLNHLCDMIERYSVEKEYKIFTLEELFFC